MEDSFTHWLKTYYGKATAEDAANAMGLHTDYVLGWMRFCFDLNTASLSAGQPLPTQDQILAEWFKTHTPEEIHETPFGEIAAPIADGPDMLTQPVGQIVLGDLLDMIEAIVVKHLGK